MKLVTCKRNGKQRYLNRECLQICEHVYECDHEALANKNIWINHI